MDAQTQPAPRKVKQPAVLFARNQAVIARVGVLLGGQIVVHWSNSRCSVCANDMVAVNEAT